MMALMPPVKHAGMREHDPLQPIPRRRPIAQFAFQFQPTRIDQVISDMTAARIRVLPLLACALQKRGRDFLLFLFRAARELLHNTAITIARGKVLAGVNLRGILVQLGFQRTRTLKKLRPIEGGQYPQTGHAVADGDLICRLPFLFAQQNRRRCIARFGERFLKLFDTFRMDHLMIVQAFQ